MYKKLAIYMCFFVSSTNSLSLPIGFGVPQGDREYHQTTNPNFLIYHDASTSHEAKMILESLEAARPTMDSWFDISRKTPMPVISSAITANASFSNFITGAMELQTLGQGQRDLFWHEYTHMMMFLHLENFMGHAGSIFHVPWMPAWFLEGLAEALSVSTASDRQATIERKQALHDKWPTYDRLHSLYSGNGFFEQGYSTSGAFVAWILRKGYEKEQNFLPLLLRRFYKYTLPIYYPISMTPITDFLPMDDALKDFFGKNGKELYKEYKEEAKKHWEKHRSVSLMSPNAKKTQWNYFNRLPSTRTYSNGVNIFQEDTTGYIREVEVYFDSTTGLVNNRMPSAKLIQKSVFESSTRGDIPIGLVTVPQLKNGLPKYQIVQLKINEDHFDMDSIIIEREGQVTKLGESQSNIFWHEYLYELSQICYIAKSDLSKLPVNPNAVHCPVSETLPRTVEFMGRDSEESESKFYSTRVWYAVHEQTLQGDRHELWEWNPDSGEITQLNFDSRAYPLALTKTANTRWVLIAERTQRSLLKIQANGECLGIVPLEDDVAFLSSVNNDLLIGIALNDGFTLRKWKKEEQTLQACRKAIPHISPLIVAMRSPGIDLGSALKKASLWAHESSISNDSAKPLGSEAEKTAISNNQAAEWQPRPIFAFPWIGANDALGYQLGVMSVPLMDHMQNETVYASVLYGLQSKYPNTEISLISTRFWPQLTLSLYRRQAWNGYLYFSNGSVLSDYIDEKGARFAATTIFYFSPMTVSFSTGLLAARRDPYIGPRIFASDGNLYQPFAALGFSGTAKKIAWNFSLSSQVAPAAWNRNYDFNVLGAQFNVKRPLPFLSSNLGLQLEAARTRGKGDKTPLLRQFYTPLKTFIPGSGAGYTQNSYPLFGLGRLLQARFGDTKARAELDWDFPVIKDWDKLYWIMYFYELRFSAFVNYGGAWYQGYQNPRSQMVLAHGYSMDMLFENKGVHFNLGVGIGQVRPGAGQVFLNAGFDLML